MGDRVNCHIDVPLGRAGRGVDAGTGRGPARCRAIDGSELAPPAGAIWVFTMGRIYLDYNASTPIDPAVAAAATGTA